jgi:hypothetical protein
MKTNRELNHAEIGGEMTAGCGNGCDEPLPDLIRELLQLIQAERLEDARLGDGV